MSLFILRRYIGGVGVQRHSFISLALGGGDWPPSRTGRFNPGKERGYPFYRRLCPRQNRPDVSEFKRSFCSCRQSKLSSSSPQPAQVRLLFAFVSDSNGQSSSHQCSMCLRNAEVKPVILLLAFVWSSSSHNSQIPGASTWLALPWPDLPPASYYRHSPSPLARGHIQWIRTRDIPVFSIEIDIKCPLNETKKLPVFISARWILKITNSMHSHSRVCCVFYDLERGDQLLCLCRKFQQTVSFRHRDVTCSRAQ